jgi:hypothetical protein
MFRDKCFGTGGLRRDKQFCKDNPRVRLSKNVGVTVATSVYLPCSGDPFVRQASPDPLLSDLMTPDSSAQKTWRPV